MATPSTNVNVSPAESEGNFPGGSAADVAGSASQSTRDNIRSSSGAGGGITRGGGKVGNENLTSNVQKHLNDHITNPSKSKEISEAEARMLRSEQDKNPRILNYPLDLGDEEKQHYIEFAIIGQDKSKYDKGILSDKEVVTDPRSAHMSEKQLGVAQIVSSGIAGGLAAIGAVKFLESFSTSGAQATKDAISDTAVKMSRSSVLSAVKPLIKPAAVVVAGGLGAYAPLKIDIAKQGKRFLLKNVIALHIDGPPTVKYSMNYANNEIGTLLGALGTAGTSDLSKLMDGAGEAAAALLASAAKMPSMFGVSDAAAAMSAASKTSLNRFAEVIFESVDFRSFAFKYKFMPKSEYESTVVKDIIDTFKRYMHPELSNNKLFYIYPGQFQITYYFGKDTNDYFHKFRPCVLETMDVVYGGEQFSSFKNGHPTEVNVSLVFRETELINRDMLEDYKDSDGKIYPKLGL